MTVIRKEDSIFSRDTNVSGNQFYLSMGQGCGTIWFPTAKSAIESAEKDGVLSGKDFFDCNKCSCHYSMAEEGHYKYPQYACHDLIAKYVESFTSNTKEG